MKHFDNFFLLIALICFPVFAAELNKTFECGNSENIVSHCFNSSSPDIIEFIGTTKIDTSEEDILNRCKTYEDGTKCFDTYAKKCIHPNHMEIYHNLFAGARVYFKELCADKTFRVKYLYHSRCFDVIKDDWAKCQNEFSEISKSEFISNNKNASEKYMNLCCARNAFEACVNTAASFKCFESSAEFVRWEVKALTRDKIFKNCHRFEKLVCKANPLSAGVFPLSLILSIVIYLGK